VSRRHRTQATIPEPYEDVKSLRASVVALKQLVESLAGQRGGPSDVAVTWGNLLELGVIQPEQVPHELGPYRP
jgi:hypothetical protein